jgi:uncharacterized repeat protein (TIGR01451 family)
MILRPACVLVLLALPGVSVAQFPPPPPPLPVPGPSPLLFVRFTGPRGLRATFFQGRAPARSYPTPVVVGLRPGYLYRVALDNVPGYPNVRIFPTVEVRGSLCLSPKVGSAGFPATIPLTDADIEAIVSGTMITKVIYLEHPDRAEPQATLPGEILETNMPRTSDLLEEARARGRLMLVVHLGERVPTAEELVQQNAPGTILFPGEKAMAHPAAPPLFPIVPMKFYDPYYGPRLPEEECLHDGGDRLHKAAFDAEGRMHGLDPEDTVAAYTDSHGRRSITCSNRVCLCVPRFAILRKELPLILQEGVIGPTDTRLVQPPEETLKNLPPELTLQYARLKAYKGRLRPSINVNVKTPYELVGLKVLQAHHVYLGPAEYIGTKEFKLLTLVQRAELVKQVELVRELSNVVQVQGTEEVIGTHVIGRVEALDLVEAMVSTRDITVCCNEKPCPPDKPLCLFKCADRTSAQVGDVVTFSLRYSNVGGRPITDVAVSDSLSGRLEYVEGSAESDRDAVFTIQENEVGSVILHWEISGRLLPGQSGRLRFKAKVR